MSFADIIIDNNNMFSLWMYLIFNYFKSSICKYKNKTNIQFMLSSRMEDLNTFLESSTIHGLSYILTTKKYSRLFWILVVTSGFAGASILIKESFDSWTESPVKTTIETMPISEIKFPKVTVCPPKNTLTDLNYDLIMTENITLTEEMRDEMFEYAVKALNEDGFSQNNWTKLHEKDKFYNMYHGYTELKPPNVNEHTGSQYFKVYTSASSGVITTQYYGEKFKSELVERKPQYSVKVFTPDSVGNNENLTLHFKGEKVSMTGLTSGSKDIVSIDYTELDADQTTFYRNFTPPGYGSRTMSLRRDVQSEEVKQQNLDVMPGFRFSWWYIGMEFTPDNLYKDDKINKDFVR